MQFAIENNSGTTFVRKGGDLNIKIKSNIEWEFTLVNIDEEHEKEEINCYFPPEKSYQYTLGYGEIIEGGDFPDYPPATTNGSVDIDVKPSWLHIINSLGNKVNTVTGSGTTIITINADENLTGKFLYAIGFAKPIDVDTYGNLGAWCKFIIYDKAYYNIYFDLEEPVYEESDSAHTNPIIIHTFNEITYKEDNSNGVLDYKCDTHTEPKTITLPKQSDNLNYTYIPFNVYTTTPCRITMDGAFGQNQYDIPKGITINTEDVPYDDNHEPNHEEVYFFKVPTNKEYGKNISYTIKATSKEDDTCVKFYEVVLKTNASIDLCTNSTGITAEEKKFFVNYTGVPETMIFRINVYQGSKDNLVQTYDCHGTGTVYYQADENTEESQLKFIVNASSIDGKIKGKVCEKYGGGEDLIFTQGGYVPPTPETSGITLSPSTQTIGKDDTSFTVNYEGMPSGLLFNVAVFDGEGNKVKDDQLCTGNGSISYTCGINEEENDRIFTVSASTSDGVYTATATVTQTHGEEPGPGEKLFQWDDMSTPATTGLTNSVSYNSLTTSITKSYSVTGYSVSDVVLDTNNTGITMSTNGNSITVSIIGGLPSDSRSASVKVKENNTIIGEWTIEILTNPTLEVFNNSSDNIKVHGGTFAEVITISPSNSGYMYLSGLEEQSEFDIDAMGENMIAVGDYSSNIGFGEYPSMDIPIVVYNSVILNSYITIVDG